MAKMVGQRENLEVSIYKMKQLKVIIEKFEIDESKRDHQNLRG